MKRVLIISPHFPPVNAPDMQRIRMSLPFYRDNEWEPIVICVDDKYVDGYKEPLLLETIPSDIEVRRIRAFSKSWTSKIGLGSISIRSFFHFMKEGSRILKRGNIDLVYFSTTAFHVCRLGPYWKRRFGVPFILDFQDPWRNDYYLSRPLSERPPKFFLSYLLDKRLEAATVPKADGILSVSKGYCDMLKNRYPDMQSSRFHVLPFCASSLDWEISKRFQGKGKTLLADPECFHIVYAGRGGHDLSFALRVIFSAFRVCLSEDPVQFEKVRFLFAGTSYAPAGKGQQTIIPVAAEFGLADRVAEITDRLPYFEVLDLLRSADMLFIPGSTDTSYTASKLFPYLMAEKPLLAIFNENSSVIGMLKELEYGRYLAFSNEKSYSDYRDACVSILKRMVNAGYKERELNRSLFEKNTARFNAAAQCDFFNKVLEMGNA